MDLSSSVLLTTDVFMLLVPIIEQDSSSIVLNMINPQMIATFPVSFDRSELFPVIQARIEES